MSEKMAIKIEIIDSLIFLLLSGSLLLIIYSYIRNSHEYTLVSSDRVHFLCIDISFVSQAKKTANKVRFYINKQNVCLFNLNSFFHFITFENAFRAEKISVISNKGG